MMLANFYACPSIILSKPVTASENLTTYLTIVRDGHGYNFLEIFIKSNTLVDDLHFFK